MENRAKVYPSKVGLELLAFVFLVFGVVIYQLVKAGSWIGVMVNGAILILVVLVFLSISYEISGETLWIKSFFWIKKKIPITSITGVQETYNPISSPAASLDRLEILYGRNNSVIISPKDKMGFIEHLKSISPQIMVKMREKKK
ncbi:PH domain-containing protein [Flagellimonas amoyensis]|uniref:PH domain-containing protein n=1 Tax=Flagellimonas amoyensis TaxID=2169401 RepID=UPI000D3A9362|nr:PH domain-containing protein [Allomuricauda amoyensis]